MLTKQNVELSNPSDSIEKRINLSHKGYINDYNNLFTNLEVNILDSIIATFEKQTSNEIVIVTFDSATSNAENFNKFVDKLLNQWGVGKKVENNGILIGISKSLRKIRISNGYGIEKKITDGETKIIIDTLIIPEFKQGKYYEGTLLGLLAMMEKIK